MSTDYASQKVAELQDLLKARGLPHTGKKADLIARLEASDSEKSGETSTAKADVAEQAPPADNSAVQASKPAANEAKSNDTPKNEEVAAATTTSASDKPEDAPQEDNASTLPTISLEEEMEKRRKRAERFGTGKKPASSTEGAEGETSTNAGDTEAQKLLDRQKRFGGASTGGNVAGLDALNQALPERQKKRGRQVGADSEREGKRRDSRRREGPGKGGEKTQADGKAEATATVKKTSSEQKEKDRLAAEKRKARFATSTTPAAAAS